MGIAVATRLGTDLGERLRAEHFPAGFWSELLSGSLLAGKYMPIVPSLCLIVADAMDRAGLHAIKFHGGRVAGN
jgi:hypothetical protein